MFVWRFLIQILIFYQLCHLSLVIPVLSLAIPGLSLTIPGLSLLVPSQLQDVPDYLVSHWINNILQLQKINSPRNNALIHISEKYLIQENFLFMREQWQESYLLNETKHWSEKNALKYVRQIKTVKQIMALKDITTQNPEPAPIKS